MHPAPVSAFSSRRTARRLTAPVLLALGLALVACGSTNTRQHMARATQTLATKIAKELAARPGAKSRSPSQRIPIAVTPPVNNTGKPVDRSVTETYDALMKEAVQRALRGTGFKIMGKQKARRVSADLSNADDGEELKKRLKAQKVFGIISTFTRPDQGKLNIAVEAMDEKGESAAVASTPVLWLEGAETKDQRERSWKTIVGYSTLGLGAAAAVTAGILYGVGVSSGNDAHDKYSNATQPAEIAKHRKDVDSAKTKVAVGHVLLGVGVVALAVSAYTLFTRPEGSGPQVAQPPKGQPAKKERKRGAKLHLTPTGVAVTF